MLKIENPFIDFLKIQNESQTIEDEKFMNEYTALGLLVSLRFMPHSNIQQQKYFLTRIISKNYILTNNDINHLVELILKIGPFQLPSYDLILQDILNQLFENQELILDESQSSLPLIDNQQAILKTLNLIKTFVDYLKNKIQINFDFSCHQNNTIVKAKEDDEEEEVSFFPYALNGLFQRQIVLDLFPNENENIIKFQKNIPKPKNDFDLSFQSYLPRKFLESRNLLNNLNPNNNSVSVQNQQPQQNVQEPEIIQNIPNDEEQQRKSQQEEQQKIIQQELEKQKQRQEQELKLKNDQEKIQLDLQKQELQKQQQKLLENQQQQNIAPLQQNLVMSQNNNNNNNINKIVGNSNNNVINDYFKKWVPDDLIECINYYTEYEKQYQLNEKQIKNMAEITKLKRSWDDIYDVTFKAAYFDFIIKSQDSEQLKRCCEIFIIKKNLEYRNKQEKKIIGCQNFVYTTILLLHYYNNQSFYKLFIGAILTALPLLLQDNGYSFVIERLSTWELELYITLQMLLLFDSPDYFKSQYAFRNNFLFRYLNHYCQTEYKFDFNVNTMMNLTNQPNQSGLQLQRKIADNYFQFVCESQQPDLGHHLYVIQILSNSNGILRIENFYKRMNPSSNNSNKSNDNDEAADQTWTEQLETIRLIYDEVFSNKTIQQRLPMIMPIITDISTVQLKDKLKHKLPDNIVLDSQQFIIEQIQSLKLYKTGNCPNFTLNFIPNMDTIKQIKYEINQLVKNLKKKANLGKNQQEILLAEIKSKFEKTFGNDVPIIFKKLEQCEESDTEDFSITYYNVLFFQYVEAQLQNKN